MATKIGERIDAALVQRFRKKTREQLYSLTPAKVKATAEKLGGWRKRLNEASRPHDAWMAPRFTRLYADRLLTWLVTLETQKLVDAHCSRKKKWPLAQELARIRGRVKYDVLSEIDAAVTGGLHESTNEAFLHYATNKYVERINVHLDRLAKQRPGRRAARWVKPE